MEKIISKFYPMGGQHCITNALKQIFAFYNKELSEEMIFGIGEGLDFTYINLSHSPMVSGRSKIIEFEKTLENNLGIKISITQNKNYSKVFEASKSSIRENHPVLVYADMAYLPYLGMDVNNHFGGHAIILFGYDDNKEVFYVSDRDNSDFPIRTPSGTIQKDFHLVSYKDIEKARSSNHRPFPANNKSLRFDFSNYSGINKNMITVSIQNVCDKMLNPDANLKGLNGIKKFSNEIKKWRKYGIEKIKVAGITNYFQISHDGGTGGGIFRKMYGNFLIESASILENNSIKKIGEELILIAQQWDNIAGSMWELNSHGDITVLPSISEDIMLLYNKELEIFNQLQLAV